MEPEPEPEPEPEQGLELPHALIPPVVMQCEDTAAVTARAKVRAAAGHLGVAKHHIEAARAADRYNMGGPQYALAIASLETALRVHPQAEWEDGRHAAEVLEGVRAQLGDRQRERDEATMVAATTSAAGGLLERAFGSASTWLHHNGWTAGSRLNPTPCELSISPAGPVHGTLAVASDCLEFQPLVKSFQSAKSANRPSAPSFKRLWSSTAEDGGTGNALIIPLASVVNCFEQTRPANSSHLGPGDRGNAAMPPPVRLPPTQAEPSEDEALAVPHGDTEAPEEQRTVVVTYNVGHSGAADYREASLTLTACTAEHLLGILEPIVERCHAERADGPVGSSDGMRTVYGQAYYQCEIDGQAALDSGALEVNQKSTTRGHGCMVTFEGSLHSLSISLGVIPDAFGGSDAGELLHVRVRDDVPEVRGRQTVHVVHQPADATESITVEWLLEQHEAVSFCAELSPYVGPFAQVQEHFAQNAAKYARAKEVSANVESLLESVPPIVDSARSHAENGRYAMASTMLTLEMLKMHRVVEEWRALGHESSAGVPFEYESSEEKQFEALGYLFSNCGTLEAECSLKGRQRMQVWGMLSDQDAYVNDVWHQGFYVLDGDVVSRYTPWQSDPDEQFTLSSVLTVDHAISTRKSAFELVATLGLDGMSNELPEHVLAITLMHLQPPDVIDGVVGTAASLLVGEDSSGISGAGQFEDGAAMGVGRELTQRTNELFARVSEDEDWSTETRAEAMRLSQSHLEFGESNAASAASADRYGLGGPQWELAADAFRNALRLRPSDDRWSDGREDGCASRALIQAEAGAASSSATRRRSVTSSKSTSVKRFLQAPDKASFDIWRSALMPICTDVFAVQSFPVEELSAHLYRVDRTGGGGRGHWGGGGGGNHTTAKKQLSPSKSGARPPREDRGWTTHLCRLFPSTICFHEEHAGKLGPPIGESVDLWKVVKGSVNIVPAASAPREHYGRCGAVLSMVVVVPPSDDGDGNFSSGSATEVCVASSDEVAIAQWERAVLEQLEKRPEPMDGDEDVYTERPRSLVCQSPALAAPSIKSTTEVQGGQDEDEDENEWYEDDELIAIAT